MTDNSRNLTGRFGEEVATRYLKRKGYKILERNRHEGHNEIDIIAQTRKDLVFVEVKTRTLSPEGDLPWGTPIEAVTVGKRKRTRKAAIAYIYRSGGYPKNRQIRFDVIEVYLKRKRSLFGRRRVDHIEHFENAF